MTILIAVKDHKRKKLILGCDQQVTDDDDEETWLVKTKWWIDRRGWVLGFAGRGEILEWFQDTLTIGPTWTAFRIANEWRDYLKTHQVTTNNNEDGWPNLGGTIIFWNRMVDGKLWRIVESGEAIEVADSQKFAVAGGGRTLARAAINTLLALPTPPSTGEVVRRAVQTAINLSAGCGGKPVLHELPL